MQFKYGTPYEEYLFSRVKKSPDPEVQAEEGTSGFWGQPVEGLDPRLIDAATQSFRADIRAEILNRLYTFWRKLYADPEGWSTVWVAGSALSHQFQEHTQPDLDVLIGVDYPKFFAANQQFSGVDESALSSQFNDEFRTYLDPETADLFGGFEVTFYVNPHATDIRDINPYAAYDLTNNSWTVHPIDVPANWNPREYFPLDWWRSIDSEIEQGKQIVGQYDTLANRVRSSVGGSIKQSSALAQLRAVAKKATDLFTDIHSKRKLAFSPGGQGFMDYYNLRWQAHKQAGTVKALHSIAELNEEANKAQDTQRYGAPIDSASQALLKAQLFGSTFGSPAWYRKRLGK